MAKLAHVITRPDGSFESWSETLPELVGVNAAQMPQRTREWLHILHPADRVTFRAKALEAGQTGARTDVEYRLRRADGTWIQVRQAIEPIQGSVDGKGRMRWFSTLQDVTEQKRAETNIRHLNRVHAMLSGINMLKLRSDQTDSVSVDLHQQRLNGADACCPSAILAARLRSPKIKSRHSRILRHRQQSAHFRSFEQRRKWAR
jgi:PAS domain S-box-containing protein